MSTVERTFELTSAGGVPVLWAEGPEPFTGALVFRVGQADETLATAGLTHMVEHLTLFTTGRRPFQVNGFVDATRTVFWASGTREEVCGFLADVAEALGSLSLDRLETERRVLITEASARSAHPFGDLLTGRFGRRKYGLSSAAEFGLRRCSAEDVTAWVRERFTSANAAAWLTGPPTDDFSLTLPDGLRFEPPEPAPLPGLKLPAQGAGASGAVMISLVSPRSAASAAAVSLACERAHSDLRLGAGLSYAVGSGYSPVTRETALVALAADCLDEHAAEVRDGMLAALESLAETGPTEEELAEHVDAARRALADPRAVPGCLDSSACDLLLGLPPMSPQELLDRVEGLTAEAVAAALRETLPTMLVAFPPQTPPARGLELYEFPEDRSVVTGTAYGPKGMSGWGNKTRVVAGVGGVSHVDGASGQTVTIRSESTVALLSFGVGRFTVVGSNGAEIDVDTATLKDGDALAAFLREQYGDRLVPLEELDGREAIEELAAEKLKRRWTVGQEVDLLPAILAPGESIATMGQCSRGLKTGLLVVTDRRAFFVYDGMTKRGKEFIDLPLHEIEAVESSKGIPAVEGANVRIRARGEWLKFGDVTPRERAAELAEEIRARIS